MHNSDTYLLNNAFKFFVDAFDQLPTSIACIGSQLLAPDNTYNDSYGDFPSILQTWYSIIKLYSKILGKEIKTKNNIYINQTKPFIVPRVIGADLCIRREVIEKEGMFDPDFFMYFEETEMQHRYTLRGYNSMIIPGPRIVHLECASTRGDNKRKFTYNYVRLYLHGQFLYFKKVYSFPVYLLYRVMYVLYLPVFMRSYYSWNEKLKIIGRILL